MSILMNLDKYIEEKANERRGRRHRGRHRRFRR